MSFKSYVSVDVCPPDDFYDWDECAQEFYWSVFHNVCIDCSNTYRELLGEKLDQLGFKNVVVDIESK